MSSLDRARLIRSMEQECGETWPASAQLGLHLQEAAALLLDVLAHEAKRPEFAGLGDQVSQAIWNGIVEPSSRQGDWGNNIHALHKHFEPFLKKVFFLVDPEEYHRKAKEGRPTLHDFFGFLQLPTLSGGQAPKKLPKEWYPFAKALTEIRDFRNLTSHNAPVISGGVYWRSVVRVLMGYLFVVSKFADDLRLRIDDGQDLEFWKSAGKKAEAGLGRALAAKGKTSNQLWIPLKVELQESHGFQGSLAKSRGGLLPLQQAWKRLVLIGDPGSGKSTLLRHLVLELTRSKARRPGDAFPLPVFIELCRCETGRSLEDLILEQIPGPEDLEAVLGQQEILLLLDGINEVLDPDLRRRVVLEMEHLLACHSSLGIVVSDRPWNRQLPRLPIFQVASLGDGEKEDYLRRKLPSIQEEDPVARLRKGAGGLWDWARTPLHLEMLVDQVEASGVLPDGPAQLLGRFLNHLMLRSTVRVSDRELSRKQRLLSDLAYQTRRRGKVAFSEDVFVELVTSSAKELHFQLDPFRFRDELFEDGLLRAQDGITAGMAGVRFLSFEHESYQEYFAAVGVLRHSRTSSDLLQQLGREPNWRGPLQILRELPGAPKMPEAAVKVQTEPKKAEAAPAPPKKAPSPSPTAAKIIKRVAVPAPKTGAGGLDSIPKLAAAAIRSGDANGLVTQVNRLNGAQNAKAMETKVRQSVNGAFNESVIEPLLVLRAFEILNGPGHNTVAYRMLHRVCKGRQFAVEPELKKRALDLYRKWDQAQKYRPSAGYRWNLIRMFELESRLDAGALLALKKEAGIKLSPAVAKTKPAVEPVQKPEPAPAPPAPVKAPKPAAPSSPGPDLNAEFMRKLVAALREKSMKSRRKRVHNLQIKSSLEVNQKVFTALVNQEAWSEAMHWLVLRSLPQIKVLGPLVLKFRKKRDWAQVEALFGQSGIAQKVIASSLDSIGEKKLATEYRQFQTSRKKKKKKKATKKKAVKKKVAKKKVAQKPAPAKPKGSWLRRLFGG
ncbi:MAG: NACHT domain-containing protein [Planctomycetota bacterium]|nr:MAG: NACHT domain-containing protein [Planctomycetota bacterium]